MKLQFGLPKDLKFRQYKLALKICRCVSDNTKSVDVAKRKPA